MSGAFQRPRRYLILPSSTKQIWENWQSKRWPGAGKAEVVLRDGAAHPAHVADDIALDAERLDVEREVGHRVEPAGAKRADRVMAHRRRQCDVVVDPVFGHDRHHLVDVLARPAPALSDEKREIGPLALAHVAEAVSTGSSARLRSLINHSRVPMRCSLPRRSFGTRPPHHPINPEFPPRPLPARRVRDRIRRRGDA